MSSTVKPFPRPYAFYGFERGSKDAPARCHASVSSDRAATGLAFVHKWLSAMKCGVV